MILKLFDFVNNSVPFEIGDLESIETITIDTVTGDEVAVVIYKDTRKAIFDSNRYRARDWLDGSCKIYDFEEPDLIEKEEFRKHASI